MSTENKYELTGKLLHKYDTQEFASGFTKREFVMDNGSQYQNETPFELIKEKTTEIDQYEIGDTLKVSFNLAGREYGGRHFLNLRAWRIELVEKAKGESVVETSVGPSDEGIDEAPSVETGEEDIPF